MQTKCGNPDCTDSRPYWLTVQALNGYDRDGKPVIETRKGLFCQSCGKRIDKPVDLRA